MSLELELPRERDQRQPNYDITPIKPHRSDIHKTLCKLLFVTFNLLRASELCFHSVTCFHLPLISFINLFPVWEIIPHFWQFETAEKIYHTWVSLPENQECVVFWIARLNYSELFDYLVCLLSRLSHECCLSCCCLLIPKHILITASAAETWGLWEFGDAGFILWRVVHGPICWASGSAKWKRSEFSPAFLGIVEMYFEQI